MKNVVVIGAGAGSEQTIEDMRLYYRDRYQVVGILDDDPALRGKWIECYDEPVEVIGNIDDGASYSEYYFNIGIGSATRPNIRNDIVRKIDARPERYVNVIAHPTTISPRAEIGNGCTIRPYCAIMPQVRIGDHVMILSNCSIGHHASIGDGSTIGHAVSIGGHAIIEDGVYVGQGARILPSVRLGAGCVVGAGAVVLRDVAAGEIMAGNPARPLAGKKNK